MQSLRHRRPNAIEHRFGLEHDLCVIEAQDEIPAKQEPSILLEVTTTVGGRAVEREAIELDDEALPDQPVGGMSIDEHLLPHRDAGGEHESPEVGLEP